jgi:tetratricopeptide (TPR) repeat protein
MAGNVNKGFMQFEKDGSFSVYVGANPVKATLFQVIKKRLMTKEQRERMILFVPTEYSNIAIDKDNFLYATTSTFSDGELQNNPSKVNPIRKLNSLGTDILIRNGYWYPIGDLSWGSGGDVSGASKFEDITALDNDIYMAVDRVRGRVFAYDFQGNMLYAFGGLGNKMGYFEYPSAIEHMGSDILVLDYKLGSLTRFTLTEFGDYINNALALYKEGRYDESAEYWEKVIHLNGNYDLAYIGIGRALLRKGEFAEAMKYFKSKIDKQNYSKAFQQYRKVWVEENISYLIGGFIFLLILPKAVRLIKKLIKGGAARNER